MKKTMYVLGNIEIICGMILLTVIDILKASFPLLGRIAFQSAAAGSYYPGDFAFSTPTATTIAVILLIVGAVQVMIAFLHKDK